MIKPQSLQPASTSTLAPAYTFSLPTLLPKGTRLLLDPKTRVAILLSLAERDDTPSLQILSLTPSATHIFLSLLQAYPRYCSHQSLFQALYPSVQFKDKDEWEEEKDLFIPLIRRALKSLLPALRAYGLRVMPLRRKGYVLAAAV